MRLSLDPSGRRPSGRPRVGRLGARSASASLTGSDHCANVLTKHGLARPSPSSRKEGWMTGIVAVGDNVVDCYPALGRMFPGGNCLNVAVFARRAGARAAYVGAVAADEAGDTVRAALAAESVATDRLRILPGRTAHCVIGHKEGDRVFLSFDLGVSMFRPDAEDLAYVASFDAVHVGQSSGLDDSLGSFAAQTLLSYDFSAKHAHPRLDEIASRCFLAAFSGGGLSEAAARDLLAHAGARGARWTLVTRGERGALLGGGGRVFATAAKPCEVVDT